MYSGFTPLERENAQRRRVLRWLMGNLAVFDATCIHSMLNILMRHTIGTVLFVLESTKVW